MLYPVLYLVYMVSGLRQGLAVCLFLGIALPFLMETKMGCLCGNDSSSRLSFHRVALAWLVLIPAAYLPVECDDGAGWTVSAAGGLLLQFGPVERLLARSDSGLSCTEIFAGR